MEKLSLIGDIVEAGTYCENDIEYKYLKVIMDGEKELYILTKVPESDEDKRRVMTILSQFARGFSHVA